MISNGHSDKEIWEYSYDKFLLYIEAIAKRKKLDLEGLFELVLVGSRGDTESIHNFREFMKDR